MTNVPIPSLNGSDLVSDVDNQFRALVDWLDNVLAQDSSGLLAILTKLRVGAYGAQSPAVLSAVGDHGLEWGHPNTGGYRATLGAEEPNGQPFIAFNAEAGTNPGTYRTRGHAGVVFRSNLDGTLTIGLIPAANTDNQALTVIATITTQGIVTGRFDATNGLYANTAAVTGALDAGQIRSTGGGLRRPDNTGNAVLLGNGTNTSYGTTRVSDAVGTGEGVLTFGPSDHRPFRGLIADNMSNAVGVSGTGWTCTRQSDPGIYRVTFDVAFPTAILAVVTPTIGSGPAIALMRTASTTFFECELRHPQDGSLMNGTFNFIATAR